MAWVVWVEKVNWCQSSEGAVAEEIRDRELPLEVEGKLNKSGSPSWVCRKLLVGWVVQKWLLAPTVKGVELSLAVLPCCWLSAPMLSDGISCLTRKREGCWSYSAREALKRSVREGMPVIPAFRGRNRKIASLRPALASYQDCVIPLPQVSSWNYIRRGCCKIRLAFLYSTF